MYLRCGVQVQFLFINLMHNFNTVIVVMNLKQIYTLVFKIEIN